ncbi:MAG: RimK-like ATPgrasp N-terminal domain-containing protein [Vulcanibacillus sp.]
MNNGYLYKLNDNKDFYINLFGDYTYLTEGYYISLDAELDNLSIIPTTQETLDAYVVPLAMTKASLNNLPIPEYEIITEKITPPVIAYPINPYTSKFEIVGINDDLKKKLNSVTMNGKYATLCQKLPEDYRIDVVRSIMGKTLVEEYKEFVKLIYEVFKIPLMNIRVIVTSTNYLLSSIEPLRLDELTLKEKKVIEEIGTWQR